MGKARFGTRLQSIVWRKEINRETLLFRILQGRTAVGEEVRRHHQAEVRECHLAAEGRHVRGDPRQCDERRR